MTQAPRQVNRSGKSKQKKESQILRILIKSGLSLQKDMAVTIGQIYSVLYPRHREAIAY